MRVVARCNLPSVFITLKQIAFRLQNNTHPPESHCAQDCVFNGEGCLLVTWDRQQKCGSVTVGYLCKGVRPLQLMAFWLPVCLSKAYVIKGQKIIRRFLGKGKCKGKAHPITSHEGPERGGIALLFFNLGTRCSWWSTPRPGRFSPWKDIRNPFSGLFNEFASNTKTPSSTDIEKQAVTGLVQEFSHFMILLYLEMISPPSSYPGPKCSSPHPSIPFSKTTLSTILPSTTRFSILSHSYRFPHQNSLCIVSTCSTHLI